MASFSHESARKRTPTRRAGHPRPDTHPQGHPRPDTHPENEAEYGERAGARDPTPTRLGGSGPPHSDHRERERDVSLPTSGGEGRLACSIPGRGPDADEQREIALHRDLDLVALAPILEVDRRSRAQLLRSVDMPSLEVG